MGHWRKSYRFEVTIRGATTLVVLEPSIYGWELKGWTYTIGNAKANPEGNPLIRKTFGDEDEAFGSWQEQCVLAVMEPFEYVEPKHPQLQNIDPTKQAAIDNASRTDRAVTT